MNFKTLLGVLALAVVVMTSACKKGFKTTDSGLKYMYIVESDTGEVAGEEGYLKMHLVMKNSKDSAIINTYTEGDRPIETLVRKPTYEGCIYEGFAMLKAGDSAVFKVVADSLYAKTFNAPMPPGVTAGEELTITVKVLDSKSKESFEKMQKDENDKRVRETQAAIEQNKKDLLAAAEKMGLKDKLQTTPSGLMYVVIKETKGATAKPGDKLNMFYRGTFTDGTEFDSNIGKEAYPVISGRGGVIEGWIEALEKMKVGEKWKLFIPSNLAYGEEGRGQIPPNAPLIFDIELASLVPAEQVKKEEEARMKKFQDEETKQINDFIKKQNYKNLQKTQSGIYYVLEKPGTGASPKNGDMISINLKVYKLDGTEVPLANNPIEMPYNPGLPPAMAELLSMMKPGGKAMVVTPSTQFLGPDGGGRFDPFTPLRLDLELLSVKPGAAQPQMPQ